MRIYSLDSEHCKRSAFQLFLPFIDGELHNPVHVILWYTCSKTGLRCLRCPSQCIRLWHWLRAVPVVEMLIKKQRDTWMLTTYLIQKSWEVTTDCAHKLDSVGIEILYFLITFHKQASQNVLSFLGFHYQDHTVCGWHSFIISTGRTSGTPVGCNWKTSHKLACIMYNHTLRRNWELS